MEILKIVFREQGNMVDYFREHGGRAYLVELLCTHLGSA